MNFQEATRAVEQPRSLVGPNSPVGQRASTAITGDFLRHYLGMEADGGGVGGVGPPQVVPE